MATVQPTTKDVRVSIRRDQHGRLRGKFKRDFQWPWESDQEVKFENETSAGLVVCFHLVEDGGTGLVFPSRPSRALWVHKVAKKNDPCPPQNATWDGFRPVDVINNNRTLQVQNPNGHKQLFKFSLNFVSDKDNPNADLEYWDPIGENRNGGSQSFVQPLPTSTTVLAAGIAGAAVGAVAGYVACTQKRTRD